MDAVTSNERFQMSSSLDTTERSQTGQKESVMSFQEKIKSSVRQAAFHTSQSIQTNIIGPMEKGMEAAKMQTPPSHVINGIDLRVLPKFICYKAALWREKQTLLSLLWLLSGFALVLFIESRVEISHLHDKLRTKEYIAVPSLQDFTPVSPQSVPPSHVENTATAFLESFGNINPGNIDEQYKLLMDNMSPDLKMRFGLETTPWVEQVKHDNITETISVTDRQIVNNHDGYYKVVACARKDSYANFEHIGFTNVVIEMVLKLVPPKAGRLWFLEIDSLKSQAADTFRAKSELMQKPQESKKNDQ